MQPRQLVQAGVTIAAAMKKVLQTQWDFGAAPQPERKVFSVGELTAKVRTLVEKEVGVVWVTGEITNFRAQASGHCYFALKDIYAQVGCVLFKQDARGLERDALADGAKVVIRGEMTVYEPRGQYQLRVLAVEMQGQGNLQAAFERLKKKLQGEGLFALARKRAVPKFSRRIGIATSLTGAALQDVLHVIERRQRGLEIVVAPCRVQGAGAELEIAQAVRWLNEWSDQRQKLDLILVTRGGGSLEDLWAFNEESLAREITASKLPVVSAVGHEIDFTICDLVADLRAATPSAAAELITEGAVSSQARVREAALRLRRRAMEKIGLVRDEIGWARRTLEKKQPSRVLRERQQHVDELRESLERCVAAHLRTAREGWRTGRERFRRLKLRARIDRERRDIENARGLLRRKARENLKERAAKIKSLAAQLRLLSPQKTLDRGYSITTDAESGAVLRDPAKVAPSQKIRTRLAKGSIDSKVI